MNPTSLIGVALLPYAAAWQAEHGKEMVMRSILRAWQLAPYREQMKREAQERAARAMGLT